MTRGPGGPAFECGGRGISATRQSVAQGTPEQLRQEANPEVVQFVHGLPDGPVPFHYPANDYLQEL